jgi:hypothetical protein
MEIKSIEESIVENQEVSNVNRSLFSYLKNHFRSTFLVFLLLLFWEIVFVLAPDIENPVIRFVLLFLPLLVVSLYYGVIRDGIQTRFMRKFASINELNFSEEKNIEGLDGVLFRAAKGDIQSFANVIEGKYKNYPFKIFNYRYSTGNAGHEFTVFMLEFNNMLPSMFLERKKNSYLQSYFDQIRNIDFVTLEGNFNKDFNLGFTKGHQVELLEVFTPDIMEEIINKAINLNLEIINNHLYIYAYKVIRTRKEIENFYELAEFLMDKLIPVFIRMKV